MKEDKPKTQQYNTLVSGISKILLEAKSNIATTAKFTK